MGITIILSVNKMEEKTKMATKDPNNELLTHE
jgi:hypothetical protein